MWDFGGMRLRLLGKRLAVAITLLPCLAVAQNIPAGLLQQLSPDQLQQLQQRQGGETGRSSKPQQPTVLEPAPRNQQTLPASRLEEIMTRRAGTQLQQFGYSQFGAGQSVSVPQTGAVQSSYVLGPGDDIVVSLRGQVNAEYRAPVDRNGTVVLPKLPPISASGRTLGEFRADLTDAVHRAFVATDAYVSIDQLRQVSVFVAGEVENPGSRILTGLSSPADALLISGGVKKTGSLRNVQLIRDGRAHRIDLYDYLTQQGTAKGFALADGDKILVPSLGRTVAVTGWVRRPGIFELAPGQARVTVRQLLALAGGTEIRGSYNLSILRVAGTGESEMVPAGESSSLSDSDILYVQPAAEQTVAKGTLTGSSTLAGRFPITKATTLSQILKAPGALGETPYPLIGVISRRDPRTYARSLIAFSPVAVLTGRSDLSLQTDDLVRVFSFKEFGLVRKVVGDYTAYGRAVAEAARNPDSLVSSEFTFDRHDEPAAAPITADGLGQSKQAQASGVAETVGAAGNLLIRDAARARSQGAQTPVPGSSTSESAGLAQIAQELEVEPLVLTNFLSDRLVHLTGAVRGPADYLVGPQVSLADLVAVAGGTSNWADASGVELTTTQVDPASGKSQTKRVTLPLSTGMLSQYILQPRDEIHFRSVYTIADAGDVTLQGQVRYPGKYQITQGEHLSDLLVRGGGLTGTAYPYGTVFLRQSQASIERAGYKRLADELQSQVILALTRTGSDTTSSQTPQSVAALQAFVSDVRNTPPIGRISVIADPSRLLANPALDVLLEPGDVVYIPQRPSTVAVLGQVFQPGSFPFRPNQGMQDYISQAGGFSQFADESSAFVVLPDGTARRYARSWLNFDQPDIPPGSTIVVPRDLQPLDLRGLLSTSLPILSSLATTAASLSVLSKQ